MSDEPKLPDSQQDDSPLEKIEKKARRGFWRLVGLVTLHSTWIVLLLASVLVSVLLWYASTPRFAERVRERMIATLEEATGGRVELKSFHWSLLHLTFVADDLTIHGLEAPGEIPYLHVDQIEVAVQVKTFFTTHALAPRVSLNQLQVQHPVFHLIVHPDGTTNQPRPKRAASNKPVMDTIFDLAAQQVEMRNGTLLINQRAIPFNLAARNVAAQIHYLPQTDHYAISLGVNDLRTRLMSEPQIHSRLDATVELGRNQATVQRLTWQTGNAKEGASQLQASGSLTDFSHPQWQLKADGTVDLRQLTALTSVDGFKQGLATVQLQGHSCKAETLQAGNASKTAKSKTTSANKNDCNGDFLLQAKASVKDGGWEDEYVKLEGIDGEAQMRMTPEELLLTDMHGRFSNGGSGSGDLRITHWLSSSPTPAAEASHTLKNGAQKKQTASPSKENAPLHAVLDAKIDSIPLRTIMRAVALPQYQNLGFDAAATGPVRVEWGTTPESVLVDAKLKVAPTGKALYGDATAGVPVNGSVDARYQGNGEIVLVHSVVAQTPGSSLEASGILGVADGDGKTALRTDLTTRDLSEFNQLLLTLGWEAYGRKGTASIPASLHGAGQFHGMASGSVFSLDFKGHLEATQVEVDLNQILPPTTLVEGTAAQASAAKHFFFDSVVADGEYSPAELNLRDAVLRHGGATLHVAGQLHPQKIGKNLYAWNEATEVDATVRMQHTSVADLLQMADTKLPVTGTLDLQGHAAGTFNNLYGVGQLTLVDGQAYGEPYHSMKADLDISGRELMANHVVLQLPAGQVTGSGGYDFASQHLQAHLQGGKLQLARLQHVANSGVTVDGELGLAADADGTLHDPGLKATIQIDGITLDSKSVGYLKADLHSEGNTLLFQSRSNLISANFDVTGQTQLTANFMTQAKLTFASLDVDPLLTRYAPKGLSGHSSIGGTVMLNGPLAEPKQMNINADFNQFAATLVGVELKSTESLRFRVENGVLQLDQVHITGLDTNLRASGTADLLAKGRLNLLAEGSINMKLAQSVDPDLSSSGRVEFTMNAGGTMERPALGGLVKFTNVSLSLQDITNGLSQVNGTLVFDQDRLQVQKLTAMTGGGLLQLGGYITYRNGLYADVTATGHDVRIRYPQGVSSMADASLRLQGAPQNSLLSGSIQLTRFGLSQNFDFAALAGSAGKVSAPPDPNAPSSHIRLNVHITSAPQLDFQNSFAKLAGDVDLRIGGTVAMPSVLGSISITEGSATFAGTQYRLQRGDIYFTNPVRIEPVIDLDAMARVRDYDITIGLHGPASSLKPTYRSEPPLPEADIFALLALGRTQEEAQLYQQQQQQAGTDATTNALLGGALNATVSNRVQKLFGVGSVKVDPAFVGTLGNSAARITVEQSIAHNVTVTYATNVNETAEQLIQVQWDLTRNISLVAVRDEAGIFSMVVKIRKRYR
ncbi:MAG: translocation/assembly module TamB domain-containing protein [Acidobacteriaceae bacterium]